MSVQTCGYIGIALLAIFVAIVIWQMNEYKVAEPSYRTLKTDGDITVRQYQSITVAQVSLKGDRYESIKTGFRLLANFIFGGNKQKLSIAMTAPVIQTRDTTNNTDSSNQKSEDNGWIIRFVMPVEFNQNTLPLPNNPDVKIITIPERKYIAIRFSGFNSKSNLNYHLDQLRYYTNKNALRIIGSPIYAFYNPPWILPFLRRNEIMLELQQYP